MKKKVVYQIEVQNRKGFKLKLYWLGGTGNDIKVLSSPYRTQGLPEGFALTKESEDFITKNKDYKVELKMSKGKYKEYTDAEFAEWVKLQADVKCL